MPLHWRKKRAKRNFKIAALVVGVVFGFGIYWLYALHVAHSSFANYYTFRGCVELLERKDTYGICELRSGKVIKLVQYEDKWFLDGDLPGKGGW